MFSEILSSMTLIIDQQPSGSQTTCEHGTCMGVRLGIGVFDSLHFNIFASGAKRYATAQRE